MPDALVRATLQVDGGPAALAQLQAFRAAVADIGTAQAATTLKVDTSALKAAQADVQSLNTALSSPFAKKKLDIDTSAIQNAQRDVAALGNAASASATSIDAASVSLKAMEGNTKGVITGLLGISGTAVGILAVGAALGVAAKSAADFQQSLANLQAVGHFSPTDFTALGAGIQQSARTSVFSITQIADADTILAKSGADANAIIREQVDVLNLASASNTSAKDAASGLVTAQKDFGLSAKDSTNIANALSQAVDSSVGTFADMTDALKQVGPVAQQAGLSLQETTNAIAALENSGLQGDTGAGLKIFLQRLEAPSAAAKTAIADLGLQIYDTDGKMRDLADIADQLRLKTQGLSDEAKNADLTAIFGARGVRVADIFSQQGSDGLAAVTQHESDLGSAADIAQAKLATLSGQMKELVSSGDTVAANFGGVLVPALSAAGSEFTDLLNSIAKVTSGLADMGAAGKYGQQVASAVQAATNAPIGDQPFTQDQQRNNLVQEQQALQDEIAKLQPDVNAAKGDILGHLLGDDGGKAKLDQAKEGLRQVSAEIAKLDPATLSAQGLQKLSQQEADLANQFSRGQITMDQAIASGESWAQTARTMGVDTAAVTNSLTDYQTALKNIANAQYEARYVALQNQQAEADTAKALLDKGAPRDVVETAVFGKGLGVDPAVVLEQQAELATWQKTYDAEAAAKKQADADAIAYQKFNIQSVSDAQVSAATKSAAAWKTAGDAVSHIDLSRGLASLGDLGAGIDKVQSDLAALGESDVHLNALAGIIDQFTQIADAEKAASVAYESYMGLLSESDVRIQKLQALKKSYDDAADAALRAQRAGTATPAQNDLVSGRTAVDANIDAQITHIQRNQAGDLLAAVKVAPDSAGFDDQFRAQIQQQGGAPTVAATVTAETKQAEADLTAFEAKDRQAIVKIQADTKDATAAIDAFIAHIPTTIPVLLTTQPGQPDPTRGYGGVSMPGVQSAQSGGAGGFGAGGGGSIRYSDYQKVVSQYPGSPLNNQSSFNDLTSVAAQMGVDPRTLMAIMQTESGYGANAGKIGQQYNYGGMGVNDRGYGFDSGVHATDGGPEYAGYSDFKSFLMDISAWVKQNGSSFSNYQTQDRGQGKTSTIAQLQAQVPLVGGYGTGGVVTGSEGGGIALDGTANTVGQQIVAKALQSVNTDHLANYCEQFVEETVQAITGQRGATGRREKSASAAFADAQSLGLVTKTPQPGDLVYYGGTPGNPDGHVAIYMGGGKQVSTADHNEQGANAVVHTEGVGPGAQYVSVGGVRNLTEHQQSGAYSNIAGTVPGGPTLGGGAASTGGTTNLSDPNSPAAQEALAQKTRDANDYALSMQNIAVAGDKVAASFAKINPAGLTASTSEFQKMLPVFQQMQTASLPADASASDKQIASNKAWAQALEYEAAYAKLLSDIENHTGDVTADTKALADVVGALGPAYAQAAAESAKIAAANNQIAVLQTQQTQADQAHAAVLQQRQAADQATQRASTVAGWQAQDASAAMQQRQQAAANRLQDQTTTENDRYTQVQRDEQDRQRALQFSQQVQATDLQNKLTDTQKQQQSTIYQRTAQEQVVAASAQGASTNAGAAGQAAILAAMHNQDLAQKDLNTKAIDDIQLQIREQAKQASLESYNLETETIQQQRQHENRLQQLSAEGTAQQRTFQREQEAEAQHQQAIQRSAQMDAWALQDARQAEDQKYTDEKTANQAAQDAQRQIALSAQASLDAANQSLSVWEQTGQVIATAGQAAGAAAQASYINSTAALTGVNTIRNLGHAAGGIIPMSEPVSLVGEQGPELISAPGYAVMPAPQTARALGGDTTINLGDWHITVSDSDAWMAEARAQFELRLAQVKRELERKGLTAQNARGIRT